MTATQNTLREIEELPDMGITLSDGCRLSARVWRPVDAGDDPVPVILEYLPYRKRDGTCARDALTHPYFARRGYACVRVDMRGNGDSEGLMADEYTAQEQDDAVEVINWLAAQGWCSGAVGMMGISWGGFNGLQVAALQPDALKAVITLCSTVDRFADDIHFKGGCLLNDNLAWGATMWAFSSRAPDPALVGERWRDMWLERLKAEPFLPSVWLRHQRRDEYWQHGSVCEDFGAIKAAVLAISGWEDAYKNAVPALVENLNAPAKGIVGPWGHNYPHFARPEPRIGFLQEALRWWDHWLKGIDTGVADDPDYRAYVMDGMRAQRSYPKRDGRWIADADWPANHPLETLPFQPGGGLGAGTGELDITVASPAHCGMGGGDYYAITDGPELPGDQRVDDAYSALFTSQPLEQGKDIVGAPVVRLRLKSDQPQAQVAVRLNDIHPDGSSTRITYGVLNLSHRDGPGDPQPMVPGQTEDITVTLDHIAYRVPKGHRIAVAVSTAYWPLIWPSPTPVTLALQGGAVDLPIRASSGDGRDEWVFPLPDADTPWQVEFLRKPSHSRRIENDLASGLVSLLIEDDTGSKRDCDHGLISSSITRTRWDIHPDDSLSARGTIHWTTEMGRDDWKLRTETFSEMWSDATHFYLRARIEAYESDTLLYERDLSDKIARDRM